MRRHVAISFVPPAASSPAPATTTAMLFLASFGMFRHAFDMGRDRGLFAVGCRRLARR
jgi:hypothetical protein